MVQKVHKFGNSLAVVIPSAENTKHKIEPGALVEVIETPDGWQVKPVSVVPKLAGDIREIADRLTEERRKVFEALAE